MLIKRVFLWVIVPMLAILACSHTSDKSKSKKSSHSTKIEVAAQTRADETICVDDFTFVPTVKRGVVYKKSNYAHSYSSTDRQSEWVAYYFAPSEVKGEVKRSNEFMPDPTIANSPTKLDYNQSGYDRGHMAPAADMKFSKVAMEECFYMTNMSPQEPAFNRGIWKDLEEDIRGWASKIAGIYIVTGALFEQDKRIKRAKITVPSHFYKILYTPTENEPRMIAFLLPNGEGSKPMCKYAVSVDDIEQCTGIDFFAQLPNETEDRLESKVDCGLWYQEESSAVSTSSSANVNDVYVCSTSKGMKYHKKDCGGLKNCKGVTISYTIEKAKSKGYSPCGTCYK